MRIENQGNKVIVHVEGDVEVEVVRKEEKKLYKAGDKFVANGTRCVLVHNFSGGGLNELCLRDIDSGNCLCWEDEGRPIDFDHDNKVAWITDRRGDITPVPDFYDPKVCCVVQWPCGSWVSYDRDAECTGSGWATNALCVTRISKPPQEWHADDWQHSKIMNPRWEGAE